MALTDTKIRALKPGAKPQKIADGGGLYLLSHPNGGRYWRFKYRWAGKEKLLALGVYPDVPLRRARELRDEARALVAAGRDPAQERREAQAQRLALDSFEVVAREWYGRYSPQWAESHAVRTLRRFERDLFPWLGSRPVGEIKAAEILTVIRRIEARGALDTAHRALGNCSQVIRYAVATGRAERDPTVDLRGALPPAKGGHFAAETDPERLGGILRALADYRGSFVVRCALRLAPLLFVRPGELRQARWADIDWEAAEWRFTASKTDTPHIVPLARQALETLRELYPLTGNSAYVFPSARSNTRAMSDNAVLSAMRRMGISKDEMSGHGFRAVARTILDEVLGVRPDFVEHQLAHAVRDPNGRAYNRTAHLAERHRMMQTWADYLDRLRDGS